MQPNVMEDVMVRAATPEDGVICGPICYDAFSKINAAHNFPCDFPDPEAAIGLFSMIFSSPGFYGAVAEVGGRIVGSNVLDERSVIHGIGPISVDPAVQNRGVGRELMRAVMDRAKKRGAVGIRLVQAAFHNRSLSLYAALGFDVREPLSCVQGLAIQRSIAGCKVRFAGVADAEACHALSRRVHGFERSMELMSAIQRGTARVVERDGRVTGYATQLGFFGHAVAEANVDLQALIAAAEAFAGPGMLLPSRNTELLRWCLANKLRVTQPMTLMSMGLYNEPAGAWLPSIFF